MHIIAFAGLFAVLNRLRGTLGVLVFLPAAALGLIVWSLTGQWLAAALVAGAFVLGENWGWTKWIKCVPGQYSQAAYNVLFLDDDTGKSNGTYWLAERLAPEKEDYQTHCAVGSFFRGLWWWVPVFAVLWWFGLVWWLAALGAVFFLSWAFQLIYWIAYQLPEVFGLGYLKRAEILYGATYGAALAVALFGF